MPLVLDFKHGDKIIVNGAVMENSGHNTQLVLHNDVSVLRGKDILAEEDAVTPAARAYFALQCAYIFPVHRDNYLNAFEGLLNDYVTACPSANPIGETIRKKLREGALYGALRAARKLVDHEQKLMKTLAIDLATAKPKAKDASKK